MFGRLLRQLAWKRNGPFIKGKNKGREKRKKSEEAKGSK